MSNTLSAADQTVVATAAWGTVTLLSFAGIAGSGHKVATDASLALNATTGAVGHAIADNPKAANIKGKSAAAIADQVLPALSEAVKVLEAHDPAEAENFRNTITVVIEAANRAHKGEPSPTLADMARKIQDAVNA
ncbi:hypothetical protein SAMN05216298_3492 [Glycomyces sambucus]|uniref:Uncharacterized protein n=1 Tax=Glycomyces sambucus TaxID=380244 RepID=A0A1G9J8P4_9ACTN|nr:hypothetical protein [Glycomyces sambucus]SDL33848.1 hypothetical protein SAMN05216298_3492 [Glycomyces sambucus]